MHRSLQPAVHRQTASATPTPDIEPTGEAGDAVREMRSTPAPLLNFDGDVYFLVSSDEANGARVLEFIKDGDKRETARRVLRVRFEPATSLRAYEKAFLARHPGAERRPTYRSHHRLSHSILANGPTGPVLTMMEWRMHEHGLVCCELTVHQNTPPPPKVEASPTPAPQPSSRAKPKAEPTERPISSPSFDALINSKYQAWQSDLVAVYKQSPTLLQEPAEPAARVVEPPRPSPSLTPRKA